MTRPLRFALSLGSSYATRVGVPGSVPKQLRSENSVCGPKEASMLGSQAAAGEGITKFRPEPLNPSLPLLSSGLVSKLTFVNTRVGSRAGWQSIL
jgi:hypothetical protein